MYVVRQSTLSWYSLVPLYIEARLGGHPRRALNTSVSVKLASLVTGPRKFSVSNVPPFLCAEPN